MKSLFSKLFLIELSEGFKIFMKIYGIAVVCWFILIAVCCSCSQKSLPVKSELITFSEPIREVYEIPEGLVVTYQEGTKTAELLIETQDEKSDYYCNINGKVYRIDYFRTGSEKEGTTGVYIVLNNELFSISSHHLNK